MTTPDSKYAASFDVGGIKGILGGPTGSQTDSGMGTGADTLVNTINVVVYAATVVSGLVLLAMLILGGITYISSGGDEKQLTKAKRQITDALVGFIIVIMAWWVIRILGVIFGINLLIPEFKGL